VPIYKKYQASSNTNLLVWHITEDEAFLSEGIALTDLCVNRLTSMKSDIHRRGFLSVRHLLAAAGYTPNALLYDAFGKPHLSDGTFISISHSHEFSAIALSDRPIGVDIEKEGSKIHRIAPKFLHSNEFTDNASDRIRTSQWCIKESAYKVFGKKGLSFLKDIRTTEMDSDNPKAIVQHNGTTTTLKNWLFYWEGYSCALAIKID
jgi:4'-phosphopantetheinyl transferase